jgi:hypothetical protein
MMNFPQKQIKITPFHRQTWCLYNTEAKEQLIGDHSKPSDSQIIKAIARRRRRPEFIRVNMPNNEEATNKIKQGFFNISN